MAFPTTPVLDDFNRVNEGPPLSASWGGPVIPGNDGCRVLTNAAHQENTTAFRSADAYWLTSVGPDTEVYGIVSGLDTAAPAMVLMGRIQAPNTANWKMYWLEFDPPSSISVYNASASDDYTQLGVTFTQALSAGDKLGMSITGTGATVTIEVFVDTGSGWTSIGTRTDISAIRIVSDGNIGFEMQQGAVPNGGNAWEDFGGGTIGGVTLNIAITPSDATYQVHSVKIIG